VLAEWIELKEILANFQAERGNERDDKGSDDMTSKVERKRKSDASPVEFERRSLAGENVWDSLADLLKIMKLRGAGADDVKEVREQVQHSPEHPLDIDAIDTDRLTRLISDVALCLPGLRGLRKLCLAGCPRCSVAQRHADTIAIGLALKAYPLPLLDLLDNKFPLLALCDRESHVPMFSLGGGSGSFNNNESKNEWEMESACILPQKAFDFSEHVQARGESRGFRQ